MTVELTGYYNIIKILSCHYIKISETLLKYLLHHGYIFVFARIYDFHEFSDIFINFLKEFLGIRPKIHLILLPYIVLPLVIL